MGGPCHARHRIRGRRGRNQRGRDRGRWGRRDGALRAFLAENSLDTVLIAVGSALFLAWSVGYFVTFWSTTGQTPGSRLMRIMVCSADEGSIIRPRRAAFRFAYLVLAVIPLLAGFLAILFDDRRRGLHDMLAGTVVVEAPRLS